MTTATTPAADHRWYALEADEVVRRLDSAVERGLTSAEASTRLEHYGRNELEAEPPPSLWAVSLVQLRDPMNLMLVAVTLFLASLVPLVWGPDEPLLDGPSAAMTMTFVVMGLGTVFSGIVMRREPESGLEPPLLGSLRILSVPALLMVLTTELDLFHRFLTTRSLTAGQWGASLALALALPLVVEVDKALRRRSASEGEPAREPVAALAGNRAD